MYLFTQRSQNAHYFFTESSDNGYSTMRPIRVNNILSIQKNMKSDQYCSCMIVLINDYTHIEPIIVGTYILHPIPRYILLIQ